MKLTQCIVQFWLSLVLLFHAESILAKPIVIDNETDTEIDHAALDFIEDAGDELGLADIQAMPSSR